MWCIYTVKFYLAIKNEMMPFAGKIDGIGDHYFKKNKPDS